MVRDAQNERNRGARAGADHVNTEMGDKMEK